MDGFSSYGVVFFLIVVSIKSFKISQFNTAQRFLSLSDEESKCDGPTENCEFCTASTKVSNILPDASMQGQHTAFVSGSCSEACVCPSVFLVFSPSSCLLFSVCVYPLCVVCLAGAWLPPSRCWNPVAGTPDQHYLIKLLQYCIYS